MTLFPDIGVWLWTIDLLAVVALLATVGIRWRSFGRERALTPLLSALLIVALLTIIWVYPGILAAIGVAIMVVTRHFRRTRTA